MTLYWLVLFNLVINLCWWSCYSFFLYIIPFQTHRKKIGFILSCLFWFLRTKRYQSQNPKTFPIWLTHLSEGFGIYLHQGSHHRGFLSLLVSYQTQNANPCFSLPSVNSYLYRNTVHSCCFWGSTLHCWPKERYWLSDFPCLNTGTRFFSWEFSTPLR